MERIGGSYEATGLLVKVVWIGYHCARMFLSSWNMHIAIRCSLITSAGKFLVNQVNLKNRDLAMFLKTMDKGA